MARVFRNKEELRAWLLSFEELMPNQMALWGSATQSCPCSIISRVRKFADCTWDCGAPRCSCKFEGGDDCKWRGHETLMNAIKGSRQYGYLLALREAIAAICTAGADASRRESVGLGEAFDLIGEQFDRFVSSEQLTPFEHDAYWAEESKRDGE